MTEISRVVLFGDPLGLPQALKALAREKVVALVGAAIRPHQHEALSALARGHGLPFLIQPRMASPTFGAFLSDLQALQPELIVVNSYAMRLPPPVLELASHGCVNIHGALLPAYRGASPLQNAILNMESETGATMHLMTADFDDGPILTQRRVPIFFEDTWIDIYERIAEATQAMLSEELPRLLRGELRATPQDPTQAQYYRRRTPEDGAIAWDHDVLYLYNLIRALVRPHPGAFYDTGATGRVVLDRYLTLAEVAALKFGPAGGRRLAGDRLELKPLPAPSWLPRPGRRAGSSRPGRPFEWARWVPVLEANRTLVFEVLDRESGLSGGRAELRHLNVQHRSALAHVELAPGLPVSEAARLLLTFAFQELKLSRVVARMGHEAAADASAWKKAGFRSVSPLPDGFLAEAKPPALCKAASTIDIL